MTTSDPNHQNLGLRQRHILQHMHRNNGHWPPHQRIRSDHAHIFESLCRRGLIMRAWIGGRYTYKLVRNPRQATT